MTTDADDVRQEAGGALGGRVRGMVEWATAHPVWFVTAIAFGARLAFALASFVLNAQYLIPDEGQYIEVSRYVASGRGAEAWFPGYGQSMYDNVRVFLAPLAFLFEVLGGSRLVGQLWVVPFGVATASLTTAVAARARTGRWPVVAGLLVALLPSQVLWSSVVLREALVWAALAALAVAVPWSLQSHRGAAGAAALTAASVWALCYLRSQTAVVAIVALAITVVVVGGDNHFRRIMAVAIILMVIPWSSGLGPGGVEFIVHRGRVLGKTRTNLALDAQSAFVPTRTTVVHRPNGSGAATTSTTLPVDQTIIDRFGNVYEVDNSAGANLQQLPSGTIAVLLRPWLWESSASLTLRLASAENLLWYPLYLLAAVGVVVGRRRRDLYAFPALALVGIVAVAAITQGNLGTAFRHRGQFLWALALFAVEGAVFGAGRVAERRRQ